MPLGKVSFGDSKLNNITAQLFGELQLLIINDLLDLEYMVENKLELFCEPD